MYYGKRNHSASYRRGTGSVCVNNISDNSDSEPQSKGRNMPSIDSSNSAYMGDYSSPAVIGNPNYPIPDRGSYAMPLNSAVPGGNYAVPSNNNYPKYDGSKYNSGASVDREKCARRRDIRLIKQLYTAVNDTLLPYVEALADEYEYIGSPMYEDEGFDRETLAQLTDRVLSIAAADIDDIQEIDNEDSMRTEWNRKQLLHNIAEALLLNEIYAVRRPKYRRIKDNFVYSSGMYDGIARR